MDTLSTSVPNFQVPKSFTNTNTNTTTTHRTLSPLRHHTHTHLSSSSSILNSKPQKDNFTPLHSSKLLPPHSPPRLSLPRANCHRHAASGYAAALLDVAQSNGVVWEVERDVRRLLKVLRNGEVEEFMKDERVEEGRKGKVILEVVRKGRFEGHVVELVKMVVEKGRKVEIVKEIMEEFQRVFYQLALAPLGAN